ncbi:MAG: hypothetical protein Kow00121_21190 [Elainellaceae cyanobacterium]
MNWYSQLTQLILSFYREDQTQLESLVALQHCKLSRRWGVLRINCESHETAKALMEAIDLLREPVRELRLAQQIKILVSGKSVQAFPIASSKLKAWEHR